MKINISFLMFFVALILFFGFISYIEIKEDVNMNNCKEITGCERYNCLGDASVKDTQATKYYIQYQNCLLEKEILK